MIDPTIRNVPLLAVDWEMPIRLLSFLGRKGENKINHREKKIYRPGPVILGKLLSASVPESLYFQVTSWYAGPVRDWCFL